MLHDVLKRARCTLFEVCLDVAVVGSVVSWSHVHPSPKPQTVYLGKTTEHSAVKAVESQSSPTLSSAWKPQPSSAEPGPNAMPYGSEDPHGRCNTTRISIPNAEALDSLSLLLWTRRDQLQYPQEHLGRQVLECEAPGLLLRNLRRPWRVSVIFLGMAGFGTYLRTAIWLFLQNGVPLKGVYL